MRGGGTRFTKEDAAGGPHALHGAQQNADWALRGMGWQGEKCGVKESLLAGASVVVLEDEPLWRRRVAAYLEKRGAEVTVAGTLAEARRLFGDCECDFAVLDVNLPDGRSLELLKEGAIPASVVVLIMTAEGGVSGAIEAIQAGAADYLVKPFEPEELWARMARARREGRKGRGELFRAERAEGEVEGFFFGAALGEVEAQLEKILQADRRLAGQGVPLAPVLIEGETGTGKTSLARWLHRRGPRAKGPLIEVNCSALPESLAESELFGHERGAFTDAKEARLGLIEAAEGGTLFLDELPSLSAAIQAKLLKAIEDREVRRVGGNRMVAVDARIIAATHRSLPEEVARGAFRADLMHRLDLLRVRIPPLRERGRDVVVLAERLVASLARRYGLPPMTIPAEGAGRLMAQPWPGNVRELAHEIERALVFNDAQLTFRGLTRASAESGPEWLAAGWRPTAAAGFQLEAAITRFIQLALAESGGNVSAAARLLGVPRDYVRYRLKGEGGGDPATEVGK